MLVLFRKTDQSIVIGDGIEVTVLSLKNGGVRLGVKAPAETVVHRREVFERIQREQEGRSEAA